MVAYFELNRSKLLINDKGPMLLTDEQKLEVDAVWSEIKQRNPSAFNGGVWTCLGYDVRGSEVIINGAQTDYATATWARRNNSAVGRTMGTGVLVFDEKGNVVFAKRTKEVVSDPGKISMAAGGVLDTKTPVTRGNFVGMVLEQMNNEFSEELGVKKSGKIVPIGVAIGPGNKVEWCGTVLVNSPKIKDSSEAVELIRVPRRNLVEFLGDCRSKLELSTMWHLEHWSKVIAASEQFEFLN